MLSLLLLASLQDPAPARRFKLQGVPPGDHVAVDAAGYAALFAKTLPKDFVEKAMKANPVDFEKERLVVVARTGSDGGWEVSFGEIRRRETEIVIGYWFWRTPKAAVTVPTTVAAGIVLERSTLPLRFEKLTGEPPVPKK